MRRYFYIGTVVATALIAILPVTSAAAASVHVLTTGKVDGPAVKPGAVLTRLSQFCGWRVGVITSRPAGLRRG